MASDKSNKPNLPDPDDYWPFPDDLDEFEREIEESLPDCEPVPDPHFEAKRKHAHEMARRTLSSKNPGRMTEEQRKQLPPGLLAYCRGEAPTPYADPTGWAEFIAANAPFQEPWLAPADPLPGAGPDPQRQPNAPAPADDDA